jgi:UDP-N-acetylmuramate dehydrogenase
VLGGGCNTLFPDEPLRRPVICLERLRSLAIEGNLVRAGAGVRLDVLIRTASGAGLRGLEYFAGIPGTAGGAVWMNAGGAGHSFGDRVARVEVLSLASGQRRSIEGREIRWGYRSSRLEGLVVTAVDLLLEPDDTAKVRERAREFLRKKAAIQPLSSPSAGCVFKNPPEQSAGQLIERAGLKGLSEGEAVVSERHANFILNPRGKARARDVLLLLDRVRGTVEDMFGVRLETELVIFKE